MSARGQDSLPGPHRGNWPALHTKEPFYADIAVLQSWFRKSRIAIPDLPSLEQGEVANFEVVSDSKQIPLFGGGKGS